MSENIGWISIYRQIQNHWIWKDANKFKWWIDILLTVNNSDAKVNIGMEIFDCKRGQSLMSIQSWASRWNVSKDTARNFLKLLEKDKMITLENMQKSTRITVCKYEDYQSSLHDSRTQSKRKPNANRTPADPNNNDNNEYNDKQDIYRQFLHLKITHTEFKKLIDLSYTKKQIDDTMDGIENYKANHKYKSLYLTSKAWLENKFPKVEQQETISFIDQL